MTRQLTLFNEKFVNAPQTEGIKYAGSKLKLLPAIIRLAQKTNAKTVLDGFAGTTRVSQALAKCGYSVICNDISVWSEVFGTCYLLGMDSKNYYVELIDHLNSLPPVDGWFTEHYGGDKNNGCSIQKDGLKKPWQRHNTRKLDAIRQEIDRMNLGTVEKSVALTSLILALDRVDSTIGHFVSYLNKWSPRSYNDLQLHVPRIFTKEEHHKVFRGDIFSTVKNINIDLAYFDPPYGSNNEKMPPSRVRYSSYYHLWTTICLNDKPELFGKVNRRKDTSDSLSASVFEEFRKDENGKFIAVNAIDKLIDQTNAQWIILSYSSGGRATADELSNVIRSRGKLIEAVEVDYKKNVMAGMKWTSEWLREADAPNKEFIFLLEK